MLFYQFYAKITTFLDQEKFGTTPVLYINVETFGGNLLENDVKVVILMSCTRVVLHPSCKMTFPIPGPVYGNPGRVCKNKWTVILSFTSFGVNKGPNIPSPMCHRSFVRWEDLSRQGKCLG